MPRKHLTDLWAYADDTKASPLSVEGRASALALMIAQGQHNEANAAIRADTVLSADQKKNICAEVSEKILFPRMQEWTNHGIIKTFRFWTLEEKTNYMARANAIATALLDFTPHVVFGFGSVLSLIRDNDFIPHDDDLDIIIALETSTFGESKQRLQEFLASRGFTCHGKNLNHFGVNSGDKETAVDVFIGFRNLDRVSWYPSRINGLEFGEVFPAQEREFFGQTVPIPADPERYLNVTYGTNWREPIANWNHPWDPTEYKEYF